MANVCCALGKEMREGTHSPNCGGHSSFLSKAMPSNGMDKYNYLLVSWL